MPSSSICSLRIAMLAYSFYESDGRVRRYAETLARHGFSVDVISLRGEGQSEYIELDGVKVFRVQERIRDEKIKVAYLLRILKFFFRSVALLTKRHLEKPYHIVHVHSVPDFEVFATVFPKIFGAKVILDIHDPVPDFFASKFGYGEDSALYKLLKLIENYSCHYAHRVITVTDYWRDVIRERSCLPEEKIVTIVNFPDREIFNIQNIDKNETADGHFRVLYPGTLNRHCGLHIVVQAMALLRGKIPDLRFDIYGKGSEESYIRSLVTDLSLEGTVFFHDIVPIQEVPKLMANADAGVALLSGEHPYHRQALNMKLFEFLAMGLPAVATRVDSIMKYLGENIAMLSAPNDPEDVARCIMEIYENPERREQLKKSGLAFAEENNWQSQSVLYFKLIQQLLPHKKIGNLSGISSS